MQNPFVPSRVCHAAVDIIGGCTDRRRTATTRRIIHRMRVHPFGKAAACRTIGGISGFLITAIITTSAPVPAQQPVTPPSAPANARTSLPRPGSPVKGIARVTVPSGDLISVTLQQDIGSRISTEGDTFAVVTMEDYHVNGRLILPKGSPGYGTLMHIKRAGHFHAGGEMTFTVERLVAPDGTAIGVTTNGATADADKQSEKNGNALGQALLCRFCVLAKRGNDMLVKGGTAFHVSTLQQTSVPAAAQGASPAPIDPGLIHHHQ